MGNGIERGRIELRKGAVVLNDFVVGFRAGDIARQIVKGQIGGESRCRKRPVSLQRVYAGDVRVLALTALAVKVPVPAVTLAAKGE